MKVEPNLAVGMHEEYVLCEAHSICTYDGKHTSAAAISDPGSALMQFFNSLDPNKAFVVALIPDDANRELFFTARDVAQSCGLHMQATVERPEQYVNIWQNYIASKNAPSARNSAGEAVQSEIP